MKHTAVVLIILFSLFIQNVKGQKQHDILASFNEIKTASKIHSGLWNKDLYGPMLLVEPKTRVIFTNEADDKGVLKLKDGVYSGILPADINIANTAVNWNGKRWTMVMLPLPQNKQARIGLLAHESFHGIQPSLGFELSNPENNHLDRKDGRIYLRLELEALKKVVQSNSEKDVRQHLTNALILRKYRHSLYDGSALVENQLELNEGLAEFTGVIVSGGNKKEIRESLVNNINDFFNNPTFVRSFAYHTIPVYGYLLYQKDKTWNKRITSKTDLTDYFIKAYNITIPADVKIAVNNVSDLYNRQIIIDEETKREEETKKRIAEYKSKFIDLPHFEIKFVKMNVSFDPRNIVPIEDKGTVYPNIRVTDVWGVLTVQNGALMSPYWDKISISNPIETKEKQIVGEGWVLELSDGYMVKKNESNENYTLTKKNGP
ncbi:hypothetical protein EG347_19845 [Chryseobacterium sp. G0186]|uniref:hypothetical protein n=1 Tax=Chryseobacterium sp. G0186 TaxID=2487064 RepID=UPI000F4E2226|nr:hypothetical protein [Chryseobacterium sp. G0186]AZA79582.1 hypothetical protein EG347_19845 [Chryseobacterium sp. G0186]